VELRPDRLADSPRGPYEVTKRLAHNGHQYEYRIKSSREEHELAANESQLHSAPAEMKTRLPYREIVREKPQSVPERIAGLSIAKLIFASERHRRNSTFTKIRHRRNGITAKAPI
jgi:hypothetical protein